ncbi:MAG: type II secretion system protein GspN [bacterium]|nr:MAG: type II secretion system protein GspN [bacterium]
MSRPNLVRAVSYLLFLLLLTAAFCVLNFPSEPLTRTVNGWLAGVSDGKLRAASTRVSFPLALTLEGMTLDWEGSSRALGRARVSPRLLALLTGRRKAAARVSGPWGHSQMTFSLKGDQWELGVLSLRVDLGDLTPAGEGDVAADGVVTGTLHLAAPGSGEPLSGEGSLAGQGVTVQGGVLDSLGLSPFRIGSFNGFFTVEDNVLTLGENRVEGDLAGSARGTVRLAPGNLKASRLDLFLDLRPAPEARDKVEPLFTLLGARQSADGRVNLRVRGTLARPTIMP